MSAEHAPVLDPKGPRTILVYKMYIHLVASHAVRLHALTAMVLGPFGPLGEIYRNSCNHEVGCLETGL